MLGKFIGVGVGPGDPELVTMKAINYIKEADVIYTPVSQKGKASVALNIVKKYIPKNKTIEELIFPMVMDQKKLNAQFDKNIEKICEKIGKGKVCVFLTIGDPTVYATYMYMAKRLTEKGVVETIPGIPSFTASAAAANIPLVLGSENFVVYPMNNDRNQLEQMLKLNDNLVIMKVSKNQALLYDVLKKYQLDDRSLIVSNVGKTTEKISKNIEVLKKEKVPYFTTVIVKKGGVYGKC